MPCHSQKWYVVPVHTFVFHRTCIGAQYTKFFDLALLASGERVCTFVSPALCTLARFALVILWWGTSSSDLGRCTSQLSLRGLGGIGWGQLWFVRDVSFQHSVDQPTPHFEAFFTHLLYIGVTAWLLASVIQSIAFGSGWKVKRKKMDLLQSGRELRFFMNCYIPPLLRFVCHLAASESQYRVPNYSL